LARKVSLFLLLSLLVVSTVFLSNPFPVQAKAGVSVSCAEASHTIVRALEPICYCKSCLQRDSALPP